MPVTGTSLPGGALKSAFPVVGAKPISVLTFCNLSGLVFLRMKFCVEPPAWPVTALLMLLSAGKSTFPAVDTTCRPAKGCT